MSAIATLVLVISNPSFVFAAPSFTETSLPAGYQQPTNIVTAAGAMWYTNNVGGTTNAYLSKITASGVITNYSLIPSGDTSMELSGRSLNVDSTGKLWFAGCATTSAGYGSQQLLLGSMDPTTTTLTFFHYPSLTCKGFSSFDWSINGSAIDANDNIWVSRHINGASGYSQLMQFNTSGTNISIYAPGTFTRNWTDFRAGPNNSLWAADSRNNQITQFTQSPTTGAITGTTNYPLLTSSTGPRNIIVGPDGNLWFTEDNQKIAKMTASGVITEYTVPSGSPYSVATGPDGALWFTALPTTGSTNYIGRITTSGTINEYAVPTAGAGVRGITSGPDNALWFAENTSGQIGRISATPSFNETSLPAGYQQPTNIVTSAGSMWYISASGGSYLGKITAGGVVTNYNLTPPGDSSLSFSGRSLNVDSTGKLWFAGCVITSAGYGSQQLLLGNIDPTTNALTFFHYPSLTCKGFSSFDWSIGGSAIDANDNIWVSRHINGASGYSQLMQFNTSGTNISTYSPGTYTRNWTNFTAGPNNSLWATDDRNKQITQFMQSPTNGSITGTTSYPLLASASGPKNAITGPDGNLWFAEDNQKIAEMTPSGVITEYTVPSGSPYAITIGSDGALWFTATPYTGSTEYIGRITTNGVITEYAVPTSGAGVRGITAGPDGALWFAENTSGKIGRLGY